jgi:hypothetical protein
MIKGGSWAIFINGSYGVGKSSTLEHIGDLLADAGQPFSLMDVDWYHRSWPPAQRPRPPAQASGYHCPGPARDTSDLLSICGRRRDVSITAPGPGP